MALIKHGKLVDDVWVTIENATDFSSTEHQIIPFEIWEENAQTLRGSKTSLGIHLSTDQPPSLIEDDLELFKLVALEFPKFTDGRAYSHARILRERYRYGGELRAVGNVLRDQLMFMLRCGFDAFEVQNSEPLQAWREAMDEINVWYQPTADGRVLNRSGHYASSDDQC